MNKLAPASPLPKSPRATGDERSCIASEPEVGHRSPPINASGKPKADLPFCDPEFIMTARRRRMGGSAMTAMARAVVTKWLNAPIVQTAYADALAGRAPDDDMTPQYSAYRDMFDAWVASDAALPDWRPNQPPPDFVIQSCLNSLSFNHS